MRTAYLDAFSGVSGDMLAGALLDAGADEKAIRGALAGLPLGAVRVEIRREQRGSIAGTRFLVTAPPEHQHRHLSDVVKILEGARLPAPVLAKSIETFERIGRAEAAAHGIPVGEVHFHEVGAIDTIVDVVAACTGFHALGIERVAASAIELGAGTVACEHGTMPVPAPGTIGALLGTRVRLGGLAGERTTPTGAALVATYATSIGEEIELVPSAVGYGVGSRETADVPNLMRVIVGDSEVEADRVAVLETTLDDATGEVVAHAVERVLAAGAIDAFVTAVTMKKGRPGVVLTALTPLDRRLAVETVLFRETPTLGVRRHLVSRSKLAREVRSFDTPLGPARAKVRRLPDGTLDVSAEYEDARRIAAERGEGLPRVIASIEESARAALPATTHDAHPHPHPHRQPHSHSHPHSHPHSHS